jgi:thiol peroxidase
MDLPFALKRVQTGEKLENVMLLSDFRNRDFGELYGLTIAEGPLAGLLARAVILLDKEHNVIYHELVHDITSAPNYEEILKKI